MASEISFAQLSDVVGGIYDSALDPDLWEPTLQKFTALLRFCNSGLALQDAGTLQPLLLVTTGMSDYYAGQLFGYGVEAIEMWGGPEALSAAPLAEPAVFSRIGDQAVWDRSRYVTDWVKPQGIIDCAAILLVRDGSTFGSIGFGRHKSAGPVQDFEIDAMRLLVPHFQRATAISRILDIKSVVAANFSAALDVLPNAVVLVDSDLRIVHANDVATKLLANGDPVTSNRGMLALRDPAAGLALSLAVAAADNDEASFGRRGLGIPVPFLDGRPSVLHVLPLRHGTLRNGLTPKASAAIFIAPGTGQQEVAEDVTAMLFDLTPAEARVFARVAKGETVADIAGALNVRDSTVKTHLLRLFAKTGTRRQVELVKLASSLAVSS